MLGGTSAESKDAGKGYRVQTLLERNADWVYGAAAFFVTLAICILVFTPTAIEVDAAGTPVRTTRTRFQLPTGFKVKLSNIAHQITDSFSRADWSPKSELGLEVDADGTGALQSFAAPAGGWMGIVGGGSAEQEGRSVETQALRQEIAELRGTIEHLELALQTTTCLSITAAREGLCLSSSKPVAGAIIPGKGVSATSTSTSASAVLRPAGYRRSHKRWTAAKDHWATQFVTISAESGKRRIGFQINTHNPDTEDVFISRAVHRRQIWDKPVFNVFKHVLLTKGLPPGRVLDVGGNIGYFTMWGLAMGHKVTTFEPMDFNLRYLVTSVDANNFGANHTLYQNAVGNKPGRLSLNPTNKQNRGNFQVQEAKGALSGEYGFDYVDTIRLDDVVDEDVLLVKIDVEGFEHKVLDGARKLVCSRIVRYIEFEFTTSKTDNECHAEQVSSNFCVFQFGWVDVEAAPPELVPRQPLGGHGIAAGAHVGADLCLILAIDVEMQRAYHCDQAVRPVVLCWFSAIGYRITGVDGIEAVDSTDTKELNVHDWAELPSELVLSLKDPMLPPGLLLELSGTWNNPCRSLIPPPDDAHWEPYKNQWCAAKMASYSYNFVPCNIWGEFPAKERRVWAAIGCDGRLGFECGAMQLDADKLRKMSSRYPYSVASPEASQARVVSAAWLDEWMASFNHYYKPYDATDAESLHAEQQAAAAASSIETGTEEVDEDEKPKEEKPKKKDKKDKRDKEKSAKKAKKKTDSDDDATEPEVVAPRSLEELEAAAKQQDAR